MPEKWRRPAFAILALLLLCAACRSAEPLRLRELPRFTDGERWLHGVSYGPHRDGQRPGESEPSVAELREDLNLMLPHWSLLRVYGSAGFAESMLSTIRDDSMEMNVMLGAWISPDAPEANRRELDAAIRLAKEYPAIVVAIAVGNETQVSWSPHRSSPDSLVQYVRHVRASVPIPVTVADDFNYWNKPESRRVAQEIDFLTLHAHPLWNGILLDDALDWLREQYSAVLELHPDRSVVLGEAGWATKVHDEGEQARLIKGRAGEAEQARFFHELRAWSERARIPVFFFEAFDEAWKGGPHPNEVEKHWGVFHADRSPKQAVAREGEE